MPSNLHRQPRRIFSGFFCLGRPPSHHALLFPCPLSLSTCSAIPTQQHTCLLGAVRNMYRLSTSPVTSHGPQNVEHSDSIPAFVIYVAHRTAKMKSENNVVDAQNFVKQKGWTLRPQGASGMSAKCVHNSTFPLSALIIHFRNEHCYPPYFTLVIPDHL